MVGARNAGGKVGLVWLRTGMEECMFGRGGYDRYYRGQV